MEQTERLGSLARRAPMPVIGADREGRIIYANDSLCSLTGYHREEVLGRFFWEFILGPDAEIRRERFLTYRDDRLDTRFQARVRTRDDDELLISWHNVQFHDDEGRLDCIFSIGADITALRDAEKRLERLNNTLRALSGISGLALRVDDPRELLDRACATLVDSGACVGAWIALIGDDGRRPIGLVGSSLRNGTSPEELRAAVRELPECITRVLSDAGPVALANISEACGDCVFVPDRPDLHGIATRVGHGERDYGVLVAHVANTHPIGEETQRLFATIADDLGFALTMLEAQAMQERTERSLAERERMLDVFFESSLDPAAILDRDFNFLRVNDAYATSCNMSPEEFIGHNHFELFPHEENRRIFEEVRDSGEPFEISARPFEYPNHPEWGTTWWDWALVPQAGDDGEVELLSLWLRDITGEQRVKLELEAQRDRLDDLVHERTEELQRANDLLRAILTSSPLAVAVHDVDGNVTLWNPAAEKISGWSEEEALGGPPPLVPPDKQDEFRRNLEILARGKGIHGVPFERQRRDGKRILIELSASGLHDADGDYVGSAVLFSDVTEREEARQERERLMGLLEEYADGLEQMVAERTSELAESRDELRRQRDFIDAVVENAGSLVVVVDSEGKVVRFNHAAEQVSGWSAEEVEGRDFIQTLIPEDHREQVRRDFSERWTEGFSDYEAPWQQKGGGVRQISWRVATLPDEGGHGAYMIGTGWDVTEERRMARELQQSEEKYRELVESARTIIVRWSLDGIVEFVNEYGLEFFGYTEEEIVGEHIRTVVPDIDSDGADLSGLVDAIIRSPQDFWLNENENVAKDGTRYWISWSNRVIRDEHGDVQAIMAIGVDRTAQKKAEDRLRVSQENLRDLTAELTLAEQRERRQIATVLHDNIGQLLAFAKLSIGRALDQGEGADRAMEQVVTYIDEAIAEMRSLTSQLSPPILEQLGFVPALEWLTDELSRRHDLRVHFEADAEHENLSEEVSVTLFQATRELITNAIKHAKARQVSVRLSLKGDHVRLQVADDGTGFDPETLEARRQRGGGFGLFNVQERINYLGGNVRIDSAPGAGTVITLVCPVNVRENATQ